MTAVVDEFPYPWHRPEAQRLHVVLTQAYPTGQAALLVAGRVGLDVFTVNAQQAPTYVWKDLLEAAATAGLTRALVTQVHDLLNPSSPLRPFLTDLFADRPPPTDGEPRSVDGAPRFIHDTDDVSEPEALLYHDDLTLQIGRLPALVATLQRLVALAPSVCRLVVDLNGTSQHGTGFRIGDDLLLTNWHVVHRQSTGDRASAVTAEFRYEDDGRGGALGPTVVPCDVSTIVTDKSDDWAVIRAKAKLDDAWPIVKLSEAVDPKVGAAAFIIQHPGGDRKRLGYVRNQVSAFDDRVVHYLTDTQEGSSGSPVFDGDGRLIALHHAGGRPQEVVGRAPLKKNEGIRIPRITAGLAGHGTRTVTG